MIFLVGCEYDGATVASSLGASAYSYWFVARAFMPVLERLGLVILIRDPAREVDRLQKQFAARGEECLFLDFQAPNSVHLGLATATVPVFAWEFDTLPDEDWRNDPRDDWAYVLDKTGRAITHSDHAVRVTKAAMGADYPVVSIPAPVFDRFARFAGAPYAVRLQNTGATIDTRGLDLSPWAPSQRRQTGPAPLPLAPQFIDLDGIVYTAVFNPADSRKNWSDMLAGFIWALREEAGSTLVFKLTHAAPALFLDAMLAELGKHAPFECRVVLLGGYLSERDYEALLGATSFAVNASHGEGQCLPLMEYMSAGRPAIAPDHTAMADYITADNAFIVGSSREPCGWPHDSRMVYRTTRRRIDFGSLVQAYADSHRVTACDRERYGRMSAAATRSMRPHCSEAEVERRLRAALDLPRAWVAAG